MVIGVIIVCIGILLLLEAVMPGFTVDFGLVWPVILIVISLYQAIRRRRFDLFMTVVLFIGIWFLLLNLGLISDVYTDIFWPIIIILVGLSFVFNTFKIRGINKKVTTKASANYYGIFSGCEEKINTDEFKGTNVYSVFGGVDLDLRGANIKAEEVVINAYSIFGGTELMVPEGYNIVMNSTAIFGGNDNKTKNVFKEGNKTIYINCVSVFGGTEVK